MRSCRIPLALFFSLSLPLSLQLALAACGTALRPPNLGGLCDAAARATDEGRNPVIAIPGLLGSRLEQVCTERIVWGAFGGGAADPRDAVALQERLRGRVVRTRDLPARPRLIAGVDVSVVGELARAAVVVLDARTWEITACATADRAVEFPYVPGLLSFRELPVVLAAFARLPFAPDVALVDGQGLAHPRRFGIACHLGVALDLPSVGVGKSLFVGEHAELPRLRGARRRLIHGGETIGCALRTREGVRPVYVSIGHRVDLDSAVRLVLRACTKYRLPEPIRAAHAAAALGRESRSASRR